MCVCVQRRSSRFNDAVELVSGNHAQGKKAELDGVLNVEEWIIISFQVLRGTSQSLKT